MRVMANVHKSVVCRVVNIMVPLWCESYNNIRNHKIEFIFNNSFINLIPIGKVKSGLMEMRER